MTPEEKAKELTKKYLLELPAIDNGQKWVHQTVFEYDIHLAKKCALIAVDEILLFIEDDRNGFNWKNYWQEVKQEINKL